MARMLVYPLHLHLPLPLQVFVHQLWKARAAQALRLPLMANWWAARHLEAPWRGLQLWVAMPAPRARHSSPGCSVRAKAGQLLPIALRQSLWTCQQLSRWRTFPHCCVLWLTSPRLWRNSKMWFWKVRQDVLYVNEVGGETGCGSHSVTVNIFLSLSTYST